MVSSRTIASLMLLKARLMDGWILVKVQNTSMRDAVKKWYFSDTEQSSIQIYKDCTNHITFNCNPTCIPDPERVLKEEEKEYMAFVHQGHNSGQ